MDDVLRFFAEQVAAEFPVLRQVLDQAKTGVLSEVDALRCMSEILGTDPALAARFQEVARGALTPLREEDRAQPLGHGGLVVHKARGLPQLNPLVEAALIERAQFDGDMPELRTGTLPRGVPPAVAVVTDARDPAALGMMLKTASNHIASKIAASDPERREMITRVATGDTTALALIEQSGQALTQGAMEDLVFDGKTAALDVPEYRRGHVPAPVAVAAPSGSALLAMTPQERKQGTWQFLSTTHGRRSAEASLAELMLVKLQGEGFDVRLRPFEPGATEPVLAVHEWTVGIDGPGAVQPAFSLIDVAAVALAKGLTRKMADHKGRVILEVTSVNTVDIRSVGWAGRLLAADTLIGG